MYFLDTGICVGFLRGTMPTVLEALHSCDPQDVGIPAMVEAELRLSALKSARVETSMEKVELFLFPFARVPFDAVCAEVHAGICASLTDQVTSIGSNDLVIAATALAHEATLVTGNVRAFECVRGLAVENWTKRHG